MFTLITGGEVYAPQPLGKQDVLVWDGRIVAVGEHISLPDGLDDIETVDASGKIVAPGFIDYHNHFLGGGGSSGYGSRVPELPVTCLTTAGVTTVVGCLGMDLTTRSMGDLYGRARTLEADGVTTFLYTGATFEHPIPTLTGRVRTDIIYVDKVIGVGEVSLSELGPSLDSYGSGPQYIAKIAAEAVLSSRIAGKAGIICLQVPGGGRCLEPLFDVLEKTRLPISHFLPAHVNQNNVYFEQIIKFAKMGGTADLTSSYSPDAGFPQAIKPSKAARILLESGVPITRITMSTDGNGAHPYGDKDGRPAGSHYLAVSTLYSEFRDLVQAEGFALEDALRVLSTNQAGLMRMPDKKGAIKKGADADLLMIEKDLTLNKVFAKGRLMVDEGKPVVRGMFDESLYGV